MCSRLDYVSCILTISVDHLARTPLLGRLGLVAINSVIICVIGLRTAQTGIHPGELFCLVVSAMNVYSWRRARSLEASLLGHQKILGKRPLLIDPLHVAAETRRSAPSQRSLPRVLVAAFRPDGLALPRNSATTSAAGILTVWRRFDRRCISTLALARLILATCSNWSDRNRPQFPIDPRQQIQVECRGHAQFVVIGREQLGPVSPDPYPAGAVSRLQHAANLGKEIQRRGAIEVADRAAQERERADVAPACRYAATSSRPSRYSRSNPRMLMESMSRSSARTSPAPSEKSRWDSTTSAAAAQNASSSQRVFCRCRCPVLRPPPDHPRDRRCHPHAAATDAHRLGSTHIRADG